MTSTPLNIPKPLKRFLRAWISDFKRATSCKGCGNSILGSDYEMWRLCSKDCLREFTRRFDY